MQLNLSTKLTFEGALTGAESILTIPDIQPVREPCCGDDPKWLFPL